MERLAQRCVENDSGVDVMRLYSVHATTTDWQDERPPAPSYLRILYLGKILQDEDTLMSECDAVGTRIAHRVLALQRSAFRHTYPSPWDRRARRPRRR